MHYWNISALANELAGDQIPEPLGMRYFLASSLLILIMQYYSFWWGVVINWLFYFEFIVLLAIVVFGCFKAYEANGGIEGKSFVLKAICLSLPAGVRISAFSILFGLVFYFSWERILLGGAFSDPHRAADLISYTAVVGFNIWYWWLLVQGFKRVRRIEKST